MNTPQPAKITADTAVEIYKIFGIIQHKCLDIPGITPEIADAVCDIVSRNGFAAVDKMRGIVR